MVGSGRATYGTTGDGWVAVADTVEAPAAVVRAPCRAGDRPLALWPRRALLVVFLPVGHGRIRRHKWLVVESRSRRVGEDRSMMCRKLALALQLTAAIDGVVRWWPAGAAPTPNDGGSD